MRRILLVEDNSVVGMGLTELLRERGYDVEWATGLQAARIKIQVFVPDVVVLDVVMHDGCGLDLIDDIDSRPALARTKVILATAALSDPLPTGEADLLLAKPYTIEELVVAIEKVVKPCAS